MVIRQSKKTSILPRCHTKKMKVLTFFVTLTVSANNRKDERGYAGDGMSDLSEYSEECSIQFPSKGGFFEAKNENSRGEITLDMYPNNARCKHHIQADDNCTEIKISYQSVAVEYGSNMEYGTIIECFFDAFRFAWTEGQELHVTPPRCHCLLHLGLKELNTRMFTSGWFTQSYLL